jgi:transposase
MKTDTTAPCANCQRLQAEVDALRAQLAALQATVEQLQKQLAAARKDSSNSSKPPSSDIVKPPKPQPPPGQDRRRVGGQPGHPAHQRALFPPERLASTPTDYLLDACPGCGGHLLLMDDEPPIVVQQVDIAAVPLEIHEHRSHPGWCPHCAKTCYAPLPGPIQRGGLAGPRLTTVIAYLKGVCHASYSTIRKFGRDVIGLTISRGQLAKIIAKVSRALERPYEELLRGLPDQERLNVDETGHKQNGQPQWIWCFRAGLYTLFKIDPTRSADVLIDVLGAEFDGVLGCD